ncbi:MAG: hypothetical protein ACYDCL_16805 [Myxococcales bacterium]
MRKLMLPLLVLCGFAFAGVAVAQDDAAAAKPEKKAKKSHKGKKAKKAKKDDAAAAPAEGGGDAK